VRVPPLTLRASTQLGVGYNDNVALTRTNKISSVVYTLSPSFAVGLEGSLARYYFMYRGNYGRYISSSTDNYEEHDFVLSAANSWTTRFRSLFTYEHLRGHNPRGTIVGSSTSERWILRSLRGAVSYGAEGAQGRIEVDAALNQLRIRDNPATTAPREYDSAEIGGTFFYRIAPKTRALVQVRRSDVNHDADRTLDNIEMQYFGGLAWEALPTLEGSVRLGYMTKDFSAPQREDFSGPSYEALLLWAPRTYSTFELLARRMFAEPHEPGSTFVVNNVGSLSWNHVWPRAVRSTATYTIGRVEHEGIDRTDTYQGVSIKVSYGLRRWLRAGVEYRHDLRDSTPSALDYRRNLTFITLEGAL
jgi:hypothetical protein